LISRRTTESGSRDQLVENLTIGTVAKAAGVDAEAMPTCVESLGKLILEPVSASATLLSVRSGRERDA
jgi:hypothetical protein